MMKVSDYIAQRLQSHGVRRIFLITGGGAMHLNDSLGRTFESDGLEYICCHHEQACAMAAEAYARLTGEIGVVNVTTGPGGINALNGVFGAHTDSIPMLVISGQVKRETCAAFYPDWHGRQLGDQEADIISMARPVTKYAALVREPESIRYHLERALHLAQSGRPGPCWLDIPVDVQGAHIDPQVLAPYDPAEDASEVPAIDLPAAARQVLGELQKAQRPAILAGLGARVSGAADELLELARRLQIPVCAAWDAADVVPTDHPCYAGRPGTVGERAGNFSLQNADVVLIIGCRCNIRQASYAWDFFARGARKIWVDVDPHELDKPTVRPDVPVCADARDFVREMCAAVESEGFEADGKYLHWCRERVARFEVVTDEHRNRSGAISGYAFVEALGEHLRADDVVVTANGAASVMTMQALPVPGGMRILANSGSASMGYDLPAAIGASVGRQVLAQGLAGAQSTKPRVICLAGDGSIMMNLQELQTLAHHGWPLKLFIWSNGLYLSIRTTQSSFFNGHLVGEGTTSGVSAPDFVKLAGAFGIPARRWESLAQARAEMEEVLASGGPELIDVVMPPDELMLPKTSSARLPDGRMVSKPLEDMFPFLPRDEFHANMIIEPVEE
jgi:acetolactate synthase-1/2/3 large subunit